MLKEKQIKDLLKNVPDRDSRFSFFIDATTIRRTLGLVKQMSESVYNDIETCYMFQTNNLHSKLSLNKKLILTQYKKLQKMPRALNKQDMEYLKESINILHAHNIYHFDIAQNLGNIMWNGTNPVIIDFDMAQINPDEEHKKYDYLDFEYYKLRHHEDERRQLHRSKRPRIDESSLTGTKESARATLNF